MVSYEMGQETQKDVECQRNSKTKYSSNIHDKQFKHFAIHDEHRYYALWYFRDY